MDTSWKNNKKSLYGVGAFILTLVVLNLIGLEGIIKLVIAVVAFFVAYKVADKKSESPEPSEENEKTNL